MMNVKIMMNLVNNRKYYLLAILFCFTFILLGFLSNEGFDWKNLRYSGNAITTDELAHIPSGYYYLKTGRYFLNVEHPPLVKDVSALPLLLMNPVLPEISSDIFFEEGYAWEHYPPEEFVFSKNLEIRNAQWDWARVFLFNPQNNPDLIAFWSRLSIIVFNAAFLFLLYLLLSRVWSSRVAVVSLFLIVFSQFSLAHGSLVAMDFMSALLQISAIISFSIYLKSTVSGKKSKTSFAAATLIFSLALLSKFSSMILLPALFVGGFIYIVFTKKRWRDVLNYIFKFALLSIASFFIVSVYYYFHVHNMDNNDMVDQINHYYKEVLPFGLKEILIALIFSNPLLKGFAQYVNGVLMVFSRMIVIYQQIFFMGKVYGMEGAGLLYFPILYIAKLTIGLLILNIIAMFIATKNLLLSKKRKIERIKSCLKNPTAFLLIVFIFCFLGVTLTSDLQIGLRHIMPIILGATILTAKGIDSYWDKKLFKLKFKSIFYLIFIAIGMSVLLSFPNYISHYNFFAGGANNGHKIATDSNFDWGQDSKKLIKWIEDNDISEIYVDIEGNIPLQWYIGDAYRELDLKKHPYPDPGSYVAVAISKYKINEYDFSKENLIHKIGKTILIYKIP